MNVERNYVQLIEDAVVKQRFVPLSPILGPFIRNTLKLLTKHPPTFDLTPEQKDSETDTCIETIQSIMNHQKLAEQLGMTELITTYTASDLSIFGLKNLVAMNQVYAYKIGTYMHLLKSLCDVDSGLVVSEDNVVVDAASEGP